MPNMVPAHSQSSAGDSSTGSDMDGDDVSTACLVTILLIDVSRANQMRKSNHTQTVRSYEEWPTDTATSTLLGKLA